jgi:hypothetical protein
MATALAAIKPTAISETKLSTGFIVTVFLLYVGSA